MSACFASISPVTCKDSQVLSRAARSWHSFHGLATAQWWQSSPGTVGFTKK